MDILVSSNLERLVFHLVGDNAEKTKCLMDTLTRNGSYELQDSDEAIFLSLLLVLPQKQKQRLKLNEYLS